MPRTCQSGARRKYHPTKTWLGFEEISRKLAFLTALLVLADIVVVHTVIQLAIVMGKVSSGNLVITVPFVSRQGEIGEIALALPGIVHRLKGFISEIQTAANNVAAGSRQL